MAELAHTPAHTEKVRLGIGSYSGSGGLAYAITAFLRSIERLAPEILKDLRDASIENAPSEESLFAWAYKVGLYGRLGRLKCRPGQGYRPDLFGSGFTVPFWVCETARRSVRYWLSEPGTPKLKWVTPMQDRSGHFITWDPSENAAVSSRVIPDEIKCLLYRLENVIHFPAKTWDPRLDPETREQARNRILAELAAVLDSRLAEIETFAKHEDRLQPTPTMRSCRDFDWLVRYQVLKESKSAIASGPERVALLTVRNSLCRTAELLDLKLRGKAGRPRKSH